jgi:hypothetical protein
MITKLMNITPMTMGYDTSNKLVFMVCISHLITDGGYSCLEVVPKGAVG